MRGELVTIHAGGAVTRKPLSIAGSHLTDLQAAVGGIIGFVSGLSTFEGQECDAYINDEGLLDGLPYNDVATKLWKEQIGDRWDSRYCRLHGPVAIVTGDEEFMRSERDEEANDR